MSSGTVVWVHKDTGKTHTTNTPNVNNTANSYAKSGHTIVSKKLTPAPVSAPPVSAPPVSSSSSSSKPKTTTTSISSTGKDGVVNTFVSNLLPSNLKSKIHEEQMIQAKDDYYKKVAEVQTGSPIVSQKAIQETQAFTQHGYKPYDPDYEILYKDIDTKIDEVKTVKESIPSPVDFMRSLAGDRKAIADVYSSHDDTLFHLGGDESVTYTKQEALQKLSEGYVSNLRVIPSIKKSQIDIAIHESKLHSFKEAVVKKEQGGFLVDITKDKTGSITGVGFKEPSVSEVYEYKYGDSLLGKSRLVASSAMELGIPAMVNAAATLITGNKEYAQNEVERHQERVLRLSMHKGEEGTGVVNYASRFWTSPESIESFWIPVATLGVGYAYTGVKAGATGAVTVGKLAGAGAKLGTKIHYIDKALLGVGLVGSGMVGANIGSTFAYEHAGRLPTGAGITTVGKTTAMVTLAAGGMVTGSKLYMAGHTPPVYKSGLKIDENIIASKGEIYQSQVSEHSRLFASSEKPFIQIGKDGTVIKGSAQHTGISIDVSSKEQISMGRLTIRQDWSHLGTKYSHTKFDIGFTGRSIKTPLSSQAGSPIYFEQAVFTDYGTGTKILSSGYGTFKTTGVLTPIVKTAGVEYIKTGLLGKSSVSIFDKVGSFPENISYSIGKFKPISGYGMDVSKVYSISFKDSFSGATGGSSSVIGGGGTLTSQKVIGTLLSSSGVGIAPVSFKPVVGLSTVSVLSSGVGVAGVKSYSSMPSYSYSSAGLVSIPKSVSIKYPESISSSMVSSISTLKHVQHVSPVSVLKHVQIVSPVYDYIYHTETKTTPISILEPVQIVSPVSQLKPVQITTPVSVLKHVQIVSPVSKLKQIQITTPISLGMTQALSTPPIITPFKKPFYPGFMFPRVSAFGGGWTGFGKSISSAYHFRRWKVPTVESLLSKSKAKKIKWSM